MKKYYEKGSVCREPLIIEVEINGTRTKEQNPNAPTTHEEIAAEAIKLYDAGASVIHAHNTNFALHGREAFEDYRKTWDIVTQQRPDIFWYGTTCWSEMVPPEEHGLEHVEMLHREYGVKMASMDTGVCNLCMGIDESGNIAGMTYGWKLDQINRQYEMVRRNDLAAVWGIYEPGSLRTAMTYVKHGFATKGSSIDLYFWEAYPSPSGIPVAGGGMPPTLESLYYYLDLMEKEGCDLPWSTLVFSTGLTDVTPLLKRSIELGGHLKVGLEPYMSFTDTPSNLELFERAKALAAEVGRPVASAKEAQEILGIV